MTKEKGKLTALVICIIISFCIAGSFAEIIPDLYEIKSIRKLKEIPVKIRESYSNSKLADIHLPFEEMTKKMFSYAGADIINADYKKDDIILKIYVKGKSQESSFICNNKGKEEYSSTTVYLSGTISLEISEIPVVSKEFNVDIKSPSAKNDIQIQYITAFFVPDSFITKLFEVIYEIYGTKPLIAALSEENEFIQERAEDVIIKIGKPAVDSLLLALKHDDFNVRKEVIKILGAIKDNRAVKPLIRTLKDKNFKIRWWVVRSLGEIKGDLAVEALIDALKDENASVRWRAAQSLGEIRDNRAIEFLVEALKDENSGVRYSVAEALKNLTGKDFKDILQQNQICEKENKIGL